MTQTEEEWSNEDLNEAFTQVVRILSAMDRTLAWHGGQLAELNEKMKAMEERLVRCGIMAKK